MPNASASGRLRQRITTAVAVALAAALPLTGCTADDGPDSDAPGTRGTGRRGRLYFADDAFVGETVTVRAEVRDVMTPNSFTINGEDWGDESVLVLSEQDLTDVEEGEFVSVTGVVRDFAFEEYADNYGLLDEGLYDPYGDEEVIEASEVDGKGVG